MEREKGKTYTAEFRASAVKLANESGKPIAQTARDIGVNENTLHTWINKYSRTLGVCRAGQIARYILITNFIFRRCKFLAALLSKTECFFIFIFKLNSRQDKGSLDFSGGFYLACCHCIHPFKIVGHSNQLPLARYCLNPSHQELAKAQYLFDNAKYRFDSAFASTVKFAS